MGYFERQLYIRKHGSNLRSYPIFKANFGLMEKAMKELKSVAGFKLWTYFNSRHDNRDFVFSYEVAMKDLGVEKENFIKGMRELLDKGYLVRTKLYNGKQGYMFYEEGRN